MTETVLVAPTPALLVAPRAVRLVNHPRLHELAEMALFDEPLMSAAPSPTSSPSRLQATSASSTGASRADEGLSADDSALAPRRGREYSPFSL